MNNIGFDILIDDSLLGIRPQTKLTPIDNKRVLSIINDYEEGAWRYGRFQNFIWDNIKETALSAKEREALAGKESSILEQAAKRLRLSTEKDRGRGSELAEIALYGIMKNHYGALPAVPKIFYKQNNQDNAKGADSVHIVINKEETDFTIWFGEAKFYDKLDSSTFDPIIDSVGDLLKPDKLKKENSIIINVHDFDLLVKNEKLRGEITSHINNLASLDNLKPKLHIPILLLHECPLTQKNKELTEEYKKNN